MTPTSTAPPDPAHRIPMRASAVMSSLCVLVAALLLLVGMRGALDEERAFRDAVACASDGKGAVGRESDCLWTLGARIDRTEAERRRKTSSYWMYLTEADGSSSRTRLPGSASERPDTRAGDRVEVTYWRGQIRYVDFGSARGYTTADPRGDYRVFLTWGFVAGFQGLTYLWCWYWYAARLFRVSVRAYPWQFGVPLIGGFGLTAVGAAAPWPTDSPWAALGLVGLCTPAVLAVCGVIALFLWRRQRGDDTVTVTPSVPTTERRFPGAVLGERSYATGQGQLIATPGHLATTTGPLAALRREMPRGLTPVRVRPPYRTDPAGRPDHGGRALVLECEDDGVPVLIVTHRKHMPLVLGALRPTPATEPARQ
ncbi:hypothetical protein [Streptomyces geranii]|uniref:hypothetical protein n=1 Tax=Streptomyces geranii TaxID=2058923 RepID=UPI000D04724E|nr:hypothetical protein [Streptomyces geranii]